MSTSYDIPDLSVVRLTETVEGIEAGSYGTVVHVYQGSTLAETGYAVEFSNPSRVVVVARSQIEPEVWTEEDLRAADAKAEELHRFLHPEEYTSPARAGATVMKTLTEAANLVMRITNDSIIPKLSPGEDINPVMFVLNHEGNISDIVSLPLPSHASERAEFGASVGKALRAKGATGYIVLYMAWALRIEKGDPRFAGAELGDFPRPSQASDRIEVLTLTAGCPHTHIEQVYRAIRDSEDRLTGFELLNDLSGDGFTQTKGLFVDMLGAEVG